MSVAMILLPVFVQVGLTFFLMVWMARLRVGALQRREVTMADIALREPAWPERPTKIANAFHNQLELPLLFYVLMILLLVTRTANILLIALAWMFVVTRLFHAGIHVTSNDVQRRFYAFVVGAILLLIMWIVFALRVLFAGL
jgi:hypothetical protein